MLLPALLLAPALLLPAATLAAPEVASVCAPVGTRLTGFSGLTGSSGLVSVGWPVTVGGGGVPCRRTGGTGGTGGTGATGATFGLPTGTGGGHEVDQHRTAVDAQSPTPPPSTTNQPGAGDGSQVSTWQAAVIAIVVAAVVVWLVSAVGRMGRRRGRS